VDDPPFVGIERLHGARLTVGADGLGETLGLLGQRLITPLAEALAADTKRERVERLAVDALQQVLEGEEHVAPSVLAVEKAAVPPSQLEDHCLLGLLDLGLDLESAGFGNGSNERPQARPRVGLRRRTDRLC
jgi:hypothetical protein